MSDRIAELKALVARRGRLVLLNNDTASREAAELDDALPLLIAVAEAAERWEKSFYGCPSDTDPRPNMESNNDWTQRQMERFHTYLKERNESDEALRNALRALSSVEGGRGK